MMSTAGVALYDGMGSEMSSQAPPLDSSRTALVERRVSGMTIANTAARALLRTLLRCAVSAPAAVIREHSASMLLAHRSGKGGGLSAYVVMYHRIGTQSLMPSCRALHRPNFKNQDQKALWFFAGRAWKEGMAKLDPSRRIPKEPREG